MGPVGCIVCCIVGVGGGIEGVDVTVSVSMVSSGGEVEEHAAEDEESEQERRSHRPRRTRHHMIATIISTAAVSNIIHAQMNGPTNAMVSR